MTARDVSALTRFYSRLGMRIVDEAPRFSPSSFEGAAFVAEGMEASRITRGNPHDLFVTADPEGHRLPVSSSHATGPV